MALLEEPADLPPQSLTADALIPHLRRCGYTESLIARDYDFGERSVPVAAFADTPHDSRSSCIAVIEATRNPEDAVLAVRPLGAPVVLACQNGSLQWWKQTTGAPFHIETIPSRDVRTFFTKQKDCLSPAKVFEGKTFRRLPDQSQLSFVDAGLLPFVERHEGERLSKLVERSLRDIEETLNRKIEKPTDIRNAVKATFWLLAAKALHDKGVDGFKNLRLNDIDDVFARVGRHYDVPDDVPPSGKKWNDATAKAADRISRFHSLRNLSTESLAHVYENALVTPEIRKLHGTHSTPSALVDYMIWQLWPWIDEIPIEDRHVFEPACGHGAFLLGALRVLRQWSEIEDGKERHTYLKKHLHGVEYDSFAIEVARLSLTLADIPHGNRWNLREADMFHGDLLEDSASRCGVLLANPPYEKFSSTERTSYAKLDVTPAATTKACEMLRRTIPHLRRNACFGVVVPYGFLHSREGMELRRLVLSDYELLEIDVFGDDLFEKGDHEAAILMGRRKSRRIQRQPSHGSVWFRRVRNPDMHAFRERFAFSSEEWVPLDRFLESATAELRIPELDAFWRALSDNPKLDSHAVLGQGLAYKGKGLPRGAWTVHDPPRKGDPLGFAKVPNDLQIYALPPKVGMNLDRSVLLHVRAGMPTGASQILLNYAPVSREAWRLKATIDEEGLALTSRFIAVRPKDVSVLYLWAILNSPVGNAFAYCSLGKRDILVGTMREMPLPHWSRHHADQIEQAAMRYRALATATGPLYDTEATEEGIRHALLQMDAAVLKAYDPPPRLERQLLDLFSGIKRKGVGCSFDRYYPPGFSSQLPLHVLLSREFERAAADDSADRFRPGESEHVREALAIAESEYEGN